MGRVHVWLLLALVLAACGGGSTPDDNIDWEAQIAKLKAAGAFRTERAPDDAPFDAETLVRNFQKVAFRSELSTFDAGDEFLRRWEGTVHYQMVYSSVPEPSQLLMISRFIARLSRLTGRSFEQVQGESRESSERPELKMLIVLSTPDYETELQIAARAALHSSESQDLQDAKAQTVQLLTFLKKSRAPCAAQVLIADGTRVPAGMSVVKGQVIHAVVFVRRDLSEDLFSACVEEELAQAMGLPNDDLQARPSIFNDDFEFAALTEHDELLLRILYDPRLRPGMTPEEAMPIVRRIARELRPG